MCAFLQRRRYSTGCFHLSRGAADITADLGASLTSAARDIRLCIASSAPAVALVNGDYGWIWRVLAEGEKALLFDGYMPEKPTPCDYYS